VEPEVSIFVTTLNKATNKATAAGSYLPDLETTVLCESVFLCSPTTQSVYNGKRGELGRPVGCS